MQKNLKKIFSVGALATALQGCGSNSATELRSAPAQTAEVDPSVSVVLRGNDFSFRLLQAATDPQANAFISPYSVYTALSMTYAGAAGDTATEMAKTIGFIPQQHRTMARVTPALLGNKEKDGYQLTMANRLWGQQDFAFLPNFLQTLKDSYGAGFATADFKQHAEQEKEKINQWVAEQTQDKIKDLIPAGVLKPTTRLVLTNAVYFMAQWRKPFVKEVTTPQDFELLNGKSKKVPTMSGVVSVQYAKTSDGTEIIQIPYHSKSDKQVAFTILLPAQKPEALSALEKNLASGPENMNTMFSNLKFQRIRLSMPKFRIEGNYDLGEALNKLGMRRAFDANKADFSAMADLTKSDNLYIGKVLHKTFIDLDEKGTEAAAATAVVVMERTSIDPNKPIVVNVDRPFLFAIQDMKTLATIFAGRVTDPR